MSRALDLQATAASRWLNPLRAPSWYGTAVDSSSEGLFFTRREWNAFVRGIKDGEFDLPGEPFRRVVGGRRGP